VGCDGFVWVAGLGCGGLMWVASVVWEKDNKNKLFYNILTVK
jgi:hypothetical protein